MSESCTDFSAKSREIIRHVKKMNSRVKSRRHEKKIKLKKKKMKRTSQEKRKSEKEEETGS